MMFLNLVIPAEAGISSRLAVAPFLPEIPAFAGMRVNAAWTMAR
jgi:hypothetical protein